MFEIHSSAYRLSWPTAMLCCGIALLSWLVYEEVIWQSYAHTRWGRIDFQLDPLKSVALSVVAYLFGAGYFLKTTHQAGSKNRTRMRLLRMVLIAASAIFVVATSVAITIVATEFIAGKWDRGLAGLLVGLLSWGLITLLVAKAVRRNGR